LQGADIYILDLDETGAVQTAGEIADEGGKAFFRKCNVALQEETMQVINKIGSDVHAIDIVVNNAGIAHIGNLENTLEPDFDRLFSVNVKGMYHVMQLAVPFMKKNGGVILNMASVASSVGIPDRFAYSMTKGAVVGMTLSVAKDYLSHHIRCNCISPARVHTPFVDGFLAKNYPGKETEMFEKLSKTQPIGRMAEPIEIAHLALYLCSDEASFITGCDYPIDGGFIKLNN
jgi:2-keto-3-deoxy-L-fuconate dehydrogenase